MTKTYEELIGGLGRAVTFRPQRHLVREFLAEHAATAQVTRNGAGAEQFDLHDLSMNGLSFVALAGENEAWTDALAVNVEVFVRDELVYRGSARVARAEPSRGGVHVGLQLTEGFLDLPKIRTTYEDASLEADLRLGPLALRQSVPDDYRGIVDRASQFLHFYQQSLAHHERRLAASVDRNIEAAEALSQRVLEILRGPWNEIRLEAAESLSSCMDDPTRFRAAKRYTETMLTHLVMECPLHYRSYMKPLGYAGDYLTMAQIYRNTFEGESVYGRVFHKLGCEEPLAGGVRTRKDLVKELMVQELNRCRMAEGPSYPFRVTSLASGPAREVSEFVDENKAGLGNIRWTLIDQEEEALSLAYQDIYTKLMQRGSVATVECLYLSFAQFLLKPSTLPMAEQQDFVYAMGIFDYLREASARQLVRVLFDLVKPGGLLAIGNALWPNNHFWALEFMVDWSLLYRTREDMLKLAAKLADVAEVRVIEEPSSAYYFLMIRKAGGGPGDSASP